MFDGKYFDWNQKRVKGIVDYFGYKFFYNKKILDLGCGHADLSGVLYRLGADITAVDARQEHLKIVTKKFPGVKVVRANLEGPWPFFGQKFDIILDLGLLCHLGSFEEHLKTVCASTNYLILETAVCDSLDPTKCIQVPEAKEVYDLSYNGMGCRPSPAAIENILEKNGMSYKRMDSSKFNSGDYVYDWFPKDDNSTNLGKRRLWIASKDTSVVINAQNGSQPAVFVQAPPANPAFTFATPQISVGPNVTAIPRTPVVHWNTPIHDSQYSGEIVRGNNEKFSIEPGQPVPQFPNLKVLYLPLGHQPGMEDAFRNVGVQLDVFDFYGLWERTRSKGAVSTEFLQKVRQLKPHLIHMQLQFTGLIDAPVIAEARRICPGVVITNWSGDVRDTAIANFVSVAHALDYSLISSTGQLDMYRRAGCTNSKYWQIGYNPLVNFPLKYDKFKYDASFLANNYGHIFPDGGLRLNIANQLRTSLGSRFGLFGNGYAPPAPVIEPSKGNEVYNDSVCPISISNFNGVAHYFSDRLLACMASGRPTITWFYPGFNDQFVEDEEIFVAKKISDILDIIQYCKSNPDAATKVGMNGYKRVLREHTFTSRVLELLNITKLDSLE